MCRTNRTPPANGTNFSAKLDELAATPARFAEIAVSIAPSQWTSRAMDGNFSLLEHACHLRDIEIEAYRARIERMLAETAPTLADVDGAQLARARDYQRQDLAKAQAVFAAVRGDMVQRLAGLSVQQRRRTGTLEGIGEITIEGLVSKMLEHDAEHLVDLDQLRRDLA